VVSISASNSPTFFSPLQRALMMRKRIGADMTRKTSAAFSKTSSDSVKTLSSVAVVLAMVSFLGLPQVPHDCPAKVCGQTHANESARRTVSWLASSFYIVANFDAVSNH
jgi:hypothetical protein